MSSAADDPKRTMMDEFLVECKRRLSQPDRGEKIRLPSQRTKFVGQGASDVRRPSREAAYSYTAMEELIAAAWPPT